MSFLDQLQSLAGNALGGEEETKNPDASSSQQPSATQQASLSRALIQTVSEHPGGIGGFLEQFKQNGMQQHVDSWVNGEPGQQPMALSPQQVEQGAGSGVLGSIAQRSGLPPQMVTMAMTTLLPLVMQHMTPGGQVPGQGQMGGIAQGLLSKLL